MEIKEFLEKFLPDYEAKYKEECERIPRGIVDTADLHVNFKNKHFPEALQNFADILCEKQRENCSLYYEEVECYERKENYIYNGILNAEQPKLEDLL